MNIKKRAIVRILLAEDHSLVRSGIRALIEKEADLAVVAEATGSKEILSLIDSGLQFDVIIAGLYMKDMGGIKLITLLNDRFPGKRSLILSTMDEENSVADAFRAGVSGFLLKNVCNEELVFAIRHVMAGHKYICSDLTANMLVKLSNVPTRHSKTDVNLSKREAEVLSLVAEGLTSNEIADKLFTSKRTIEGHRKNLIDKTGVKNTATLIRFAVTNGLLNQH